VKAGRAAGALVALALAAAAGGCGGGDGGGGSAASEPQSTVERTKVEVVEGLGGKQFDPAAIFRRFSPGVVTITSLFGSAQDLENVLNGQGQAGLGTGFVINDQGQIVTNAHVVTQGRGKRITKAREVYVQFADGNQVSAHIVGFDPNSDVGLIEVDPKGLKLVPLKLGHSSAARVGEPVAAIGSPFGEEQSLSIGVVSATDRTIEALTDFQIGDAIQTDAAINRGNSGGPLMNAGGQVIGINSQIRSSSGGSEGVGFAVPIDTVKRSLDQLRSGGVARYGFLGVSSQALYPQLAKRLDLPVDQGAIVVDVVNGGPADKAGIKGGGKEIRFQATLVKPGGDVIVAVNDRKISRQHDLSELISRFRPGDVVTLKIIRGGKEREVRVELGARPATVPQ
jgi:S1-C subfamily serine protease